MSSGAMSASTTTTTTTTKPSPMALSIALPLAFVTLAVPYVLSALFTPIADCDEAFNYWDPLHFILFSHGLQTWEYSPQFALRSYAYLYLFAPIIRFAAFLQPLFPILPPHILSFYTLRVVLALFTAATLLLLYVAVHRHFPRAAWLFLLFAASSPGLVRAAVELLPSSFAMQFLTMAVAFWMLHRPFAAVFCVAFAAMLGWAFSAALALPIALHMMLSRGGFVAFVRNAVSSAVIILAYMVPIDSFLFGRVVVAPLNHIMYNVFPPKGAGSHLYGVEPPSFYISNLILNCNIPAILHAAFPLIFLISTIFRLKSSEHLYKRALYLSPTYVILPIFLAQPHKEERFLAPCYPFIAMVAAVTLVDCMDILFGSPQKKISKGKEPPYATIVPYRLLRVFLSTAVVLAVAVLGCSRVVMQIHAYRAPLRAYRRLAEHIISEREVGLNHDINVCVGKEWYRFPSSFFLPDSSTHLKFIRDGYGGLLPKSYVRIWNSTRIEQLGMNQFNREDPQQFYDWENGACHYYIDLWQTDKKGVIPMRSDDVQMIQKWPFLDSERSPGGIRAFYVPWLQSRLMYGQYVLLRNARLTDTTGMHNT